jgi:CheY-like chemotaxis protein
MSIPNKILIMDDDPDHLLFCTLVFQRRGYLVHNSRGCDPNEFHRILSEFAPDLIFLDHSMQGISGPEAIHLLRSQPQFAQIPVIYFSGEQNIRLLSQEAGANAHLKKPFTIQRLLDLTRQFIP